MNLAPQLLAKCGEISNEPMYHHSPPPTARGPVKKFVEYAFALIGDSLGRG